MAVVELNLFDHLFQSNLYPVYEWLRNEAPVYHNERLDFWALSAPTTCCTRCTTPRPTRPRRAWPFEDDGQGARSR
ncbi:MAG: hypothetical protein U0W40_11390 [Acidimicrobiia bacterium]